MLGSDFKVFHHKLTKPKAFNPVIFSGKRGDSSKVLQKKLILP